MFDLLALQAFVAIVDSRGLAKASQSLAIPKPTLSYRLRKLEEQVGAPLVRMGPHSFGVTAIGSELYPSAQQAVGQLKSLHARFAKSGSFMTGVVRYTAPVAMCQYVLTPLLKNLTDKHTDIQFEQHADDKYSDINSLGLDFAVRAHESSLPNSKLIQRRIGEVEWGLFASPSYISTYGAPLMPTDLVDHIGLGRGRSGNIQLDLTSRDGSIFRTKLRCVSASTDIHSLILSARAGQGIVSIPRYIASPELANGTLKNVLDKWSSGRKTISIVYPNSPYRNSATRCAIDYIVDNYPRMIRFK